MAIVVCVDIAIYNKGTARPTGGAGAVAFLVGPEAPMVFERGLRSCYAQNVYDFYKPIGDTEYPLVDGLLSMNTYLSSLDFCYKQYKEKSQQIYGQKRTLNSFEAVLFHSPFTRLTQKAFAKISFCGLFSKSIRN